jgi:hypothetical protein
MNHRLLRIAFVLWATCLFAQQQNRPFEQQSSSSIAYRRENRSDIVDIRNILYELVGTGIPGRPKDQRLVLRKTVRTKQVVDEIGMEATTTIEAWPLGVDLKEKPLYSMTASGADPVTVNNELLVVSRGLEEVAWWSAYKLGSGAHLFDTYVPLVQFSTTRDTQTLRYAGLEVPPDDTSDPRLKAPNVVAVLTYASGERVIREALVTSDDSKQAQLLRSYADASRAFEFSSGALKLSISQNYPSAPKPIVMTVPIARDDLDVARTQTPAGIHVTAWKR